MTATMTFQIAAVRRGYELIAKSDGTWAVCDEDGETVVDDATKEGAVAVFNSVTASKLTVMSAWEAGQR